jgi:hypothetical protein
MKIWLDDIRDAPDDSWFVIRSPWACLAVIVVMDEYDPENGLEVLSLDHDLAAFDYKGEERTGYWLLCRLEELAHKYPQFRSKLPKEYRIHSANPVGRRNMQAAIDSLERIKNS